MEVKALCLEVGDCWCQLNIIVEIAIGSFHFTSLTLICFCQLFRVVSIVVFVVIVLIVCRVPHPMKIVKFTYDIGDNVQFKCGGEDWVQIGFKTCQKVSNFSSFCRYIRPDALLVSGRHDPLCETLAFMFTILCCLYVVSVLSNPNDELSLLCCVLETMITTKTL